MFKKNNPYEKRNEMSISVMKKYPNSVPVIVEKASASSGKVDLSKTKYMVPKTLSMGDFSREVRKHLSTPSGAMEAIFMMAIPDNDKNGILCINSSMMSDIYDKHSSNDGFLYFELALENTFGTERIYHSML